MARERSDLAQRRAGLTRSLSGTGRAVDSFEHPGLFMVPLGRLRAMSVAAKTHEPRAMRPATDSTEDWLSQTAAEDEGMPPKRERRGPRRSGARPAPRRCSGPVVAYLRGEL